MQMLLSTVSQYETNKIRSDGVSKTYICNEEQMLTYNITLIDIQDKTEYKSEREHTTLSLICR
jgi:hypothetical protein